MERNRIIAVALALVATICVIIAGKSCTDDAIAQRKDVKLHSNTVDQNVTHGIEIRTGAPTETKVQEYDIFGRPVEPTTTIKLVEYDLFGNPITTAPTETEASEEITDENGEPVESTSAETASEGEENTSAEDKTDSEDNTEPVSTAPPKISGFNHGEYDDDGNLKPTIPPDFAIIIR